MMISLVVLPIEILGHGHFGLFFKLSIKIGTFIQSFFGSQMHQNQDHRNQDSREQHQEDRHQVAQAEEARFRIKYDYET